MTKGGGPVPRGALRVTRGALRVTRGRAAVVGTRPSLARKPRREKKKNAAMSISVDSAVLTALLMVRATKPGTVPGSERPRSGIDGHSK